MHKNFRNSNQVHPIVQKILENFSPKNTSESEEDFDINLPLIERKNVKNLIEKRVQMIGKMLPLSENKIRERLLSFIKNNRVAMRYEQACCRHIKDFSAAAFLLCEVCNYAHEHLEWESCKSCGAFNKYRF